MTQLLCMLGLHHRTWQPAVRTSREIWLQIRACTRCHRLLRSRRLGRH